MRLTSRLTGWDVNIEKDESAAQVFSAKLNQAAQALVNALHVDAALADQIINAGFPNVEALLDVEPQDIADALSIDPVEAQRIHAAAQQFASPAEAKGTATAEAQP